MDLKTLNFELPVTRKMVNPDFKQAFINPSSRPFVRINRGELFLLFTARES